MSTAATLRGWEVEKPQAAFAIAGILHLIFFLTLGALSVWQKPEIVLKVVNIRLGDGGKGMKLHPDEPSAPELMSESSPPPEASPQPQAAAPAPAPAMMAPAPAVPAARPKAQAQARPSPKPAAKPNAPWMRERAEGESLLAKPARTLKEYVEKGDAKKLLSPETDKAVTSRYTQVLSLWLYKFRDYPEEALAQSQQGVAMIRLRIDRTGRILYYRLERSTGYPLLDDAVRELVWKSAPVPEVPGHYPGGQQLEFLIPIAFTLD